MNTLYPKGREAFLTGEIDWLGDDIKVVICEAGYVYDDAHEFLSDVTDVIDTSGNLTNKSATDGIADADDVTFTAVPAGPDIERVIVFQDTGNPATSRLIVYYDRNTASVQIELTPSGLDVLVQWSNGALKMFRL